MDRIELLESVNQNSSNWRLVVEEGDKENACSSNDVFMIQERCIYLVIALHKFHLRRRLRHFFEFMCKVTYLCYFFKILCYFSKILCYFFEILCYFFPNLFGLNKNLFHLSNNYVITPIIMCVRDNIC